MTFQAYVRTLRIGAAFGQISHGKTATETAFEQGWESLSGFGEAFRRVMGAAPTRVGVPVIPMTRIETPLGPMLAGATEEGICLLEFVDRRMIETQLVRLNRIFRATLVPGKSPHFDRLSEELSAYFAGRQRRFEVPLDLKGTEFQRKVWSALLTVPYGETRSYSEQARIVGDPRAIRAVARANGDNRIAILVPCHRVIGADGSLTGYGGGLWRKQTTSGPTSRGRVPPRNHLTDASPTSAPERPALRNIGSFLRGSLPDRVLHEEVLRQEVVHLDRDEAGGGHRGIHLLP
jgi:AraC family transcriptional regulator of adaptative response/methylated-DNA-[protein]-cysteine methyltransferase